MARKKILIPGGNLNEVYLIDAAHSLGMEVITSGFKKDAPGHQHSDKYICADSWDKEAMLKVAQDEHIDYMCSSAFDGAYLSTSYVCEKLGLPGHDPYETALTIHQKDRFKALAKKIGLSTPPAEVFTSQDEALSYLKKHFDGGGQKLIMKPIDSSGGRGITDVSDFSECAAAVQRAFDGSQAKRIVIEPFIEGVLYSSSVFLVNKKVVFCFIDETTQKVFHVDFAMSSTRRKKELEAKLIPEFEKVAEALNLTDGKLHTNCILDSEGKVWILEMHRRSSGSLYGKFVEDSTGLKWGEWIVKGECGIDTKDFPRGVEQSGCHMFYIVAVKKNGVYKGVVIDDKIKPMVTAVYHRYPAGYVFTPADANRRAEEICLSCPSYEFMLELTENPDKYFKVIVEEK